MGKFVRKRLSYNDAVVLQAHLIRAAADIGQSEYDWLAEHPDPDVRIAVKGLEESINALAHEFASVSVHIQR